MARKFTILHFWIFWTFISTIANFLGKIAYYLCIRVFRSFGDYSKWKFSSGRYEALSYETTRIQKKCQMKGRPHHPKRWSLFRLNYINIKINNLKLVWPGILLNRLFYSRYHREEIMMENYLKKFYILMVISPWWTTLVDSL